MKLNTPWVGGFCCLHSEDRRHPFQQHLCGFCVNAAGWIARHQSSFACLCLSVCLFYIFSKVPGVLSSSTLTSVSSSQYLFFLSSFFFLHAGLLNPRWRFKAGGAQVEKEEDEEGGGGGGGGGRGRHVRNRGGAHRSVRSVSQSVSLTPSTPETRRTSSYCEKRGNEGGASTAFLQTADTCSSSVKSRKKSGLRATNDQ